MRLTDRQSSGRNSAFRGHDVLYRRTGAGEPLLLMHGFPAASWGWRKPWSGPGRRFDVVAPDTIGFGFSDEPADRDHSLLDQATLHETPLSELGIPTVRVPAHDHGGSVARELPARRGGRWRPCSPGAPGAGASAASSELAPDRP